MMPVLAPLHRAHDRSASSRGANGQALVQHRVLRDGHQLGVGAADRKRAGEIILGVICDCPLSITGAMERTPSRTYATARPTAVVGGLG